MARKSNDGIAVLCSSCGYGTKGYTGMPCPDCGTEMVPDSDVVDHERAMVGIGKEEDADEMMEKGLLAGDDPYKMEESLEEMAHNELERDEGWGDEQY